MIVSYHSREICTRFVVHLSTIFHVFFFFSYADAATGLIRATPGIQDIGAEKVPMGAVTLRRVQNVLGLANTDRHVLRSHRSAVQRQFRQHGQTVHGQ